MWRFKNYPHTYALVTPLINAGIMRKPGWYDAVRMCPPRLKLNDEKPPTIVLPEQSLYNSLIRKKPMLELEEEKLNENYRTIAHRFSIKQLKYMENEQMTQKDAYARCEQEFADEIMAFEKKLEDVHMFGAKKASFYQIQSNITRHGRTANTLSKILELRLEVAGGLPLWKQDIDDPAPTERRRQAKIDRLMNDPAIREAKQMFSVMKPPALRVLEKLITEPDMVDKSFYENELRAHVRFLRTAAADGERDSIRLESIRKELGVLRRDLQRVQNHLDANPRFAELPTSLRILLIQSFRRGLRYNLLPMELTEHRKKFSPTSPLIHKQLDYSQTAYQKILSQMHRLKKALDRETEVRTAFEIELAHSKVPTQREMEWWYSSPERKILEANAAAFRKGSLPAVDPSAPAPKAWKRK